MRTQVKRAFTLIEILIVVVILGILAAIVIPQFTDASQQAQTSSVQSQLQTIRSQIELFRVKNPATTLDLIGSNPQWTQLVDANPPFLHAAPKNPMVSDPQYQTTVAAAAGANVAWVWRDRGNGVYDLFACDAAGAELPY